MNKENLNNNEEQWFKGINKDELGIPPSQIKKEELNKDLFLESAADKAAEKIEFKSSKKEEIPRFIRLLEEDKKKKDDKKDFEKMMEEAGNAQIEFVVAHKKREKELASKMTKEDALADTRRVLNELKNADLKSIEKYNFYLEQMTEMLKKYGNSKVAKLYRGALEISKSVQGAKTEEEIFKKAGGEKIKEQKRVEENPRDELKEIELTEEEKELEEGYQEWIAGELNDEQFEKKLFDMEVKTRSEEVVKLIHDARVDLKSGKKDGDKKEDLPDDDKKKPDESYQDWLRRRLDNKQSDDKKIDDQNDKDYPLAKIPKHPLDNVKKDPLVVVDKDYPLAKRFDGKAETLEQVQERKKSFEEAAQAVIEAEARLKKAEKNYKKFGALFSAFNLKKSADGATVDELQNARDILKKAKDNYGDLTRRYREEAFQDENVDSKTQKYNSIMAKMDAEDILYKTRDEYEKTHKGPGGKVLEKLKGVLDGYHKLSFKQHIMIMGGLILISGGSALALNAALAGAGAMATVAVVLERALSTVAGVATTEAMIENKLKKHRKKKGQTVEDQRKFTEEYVAQSTEGFDINTPEGKLAFLNQSDKEASAEFRRRILDLEKTKNRQNIAKWMAAGGVGALFATGVAQDLIGKGMKWAWDKSGAGDLFQWAYKNSGAKIAIETKFEKIPPKPIAGPKLTEFEPSLKSPAGKQSLQFPESTPQFRGGVEIGEKIAEQGAKITEKAAEDLIVKTPKGGGIWSVAKEQLSNQEWFNKLDKVQQTHALDTIKREVIKRRAEQGLGELLKEGESLNLSVIKDSNFINKLRPRYIEGAGDIVKGSAKYENIQKVEEKLKNWFLNERKPGEILTTDRAKNIVGGITERAKTAVEKTITKEPGPLMPLMPKPTMSIPIMPKPTMSVPKMPTSQLAPKMSTVSSFPESGQIAKILESITQKEVDLLGKYPAKNFLKSANPTHVDLDWTDKKGIEAFKKMREIAKKTKEIIGNPKRGEKYTNWINRAREAAKLDLLKVKKSGDLVSEQIDKLL